MAVPYGPEREMLEAQRIAGTGSMSATTVKHSGAGGRITAKYI